MMFGANLKAAREYKGLSQQDIADMFGITRNAVSNWEHDKNAPGIMRLTVLSNRLGYSTDALTSPDFNPSIANGGQSAINIDNNVSAGPDIQRGCPEVSWTTAGAFCDTPDNFHPGDAENWWPCPVKCSKHTYVLRVDGISMEDEYRSGDLIFIDPMLAPTSGDDVVVRIDGTSKTTFKHYIIEEDGTAILKALNKNWPDPIIKVTEDATICGVVVFSGKVRK